MRSIAVYCGSADAVHTDFLAGARSMGNVLAERGIRLIYGGGRTGLMGALANGVIEKGGEAVGVIIASMNTNALAHQGLSKLEVTATMHERKARMHDLADGFIAMPGGYGTFDELFETITWSQIGIHAKPIGLLNTRNYFDHLMQAIMHAEQEGFIFAEHRKMLMSFADPRALLDAMEKYEHPHGAAQRWMREE